MKKFPFKKFIQQTGINMADTILSTLNQYNNYTDNIYGRVYDGTATVNGKLNGKQAITEEYPITIYVHCMS